MDSRDPRPSHRVPARTELPLLRRTRGTIPSAILTALAIAFLVVGAARGQSTEWPGYAADNASSKYSSLDQIDADNIGELEIVWRWKSIDFGAAKEHQGLRPAGTFQSTPVMQDSRLMLSTGLGVAAAAHPGTGEILWYYDPYSDSDRTIRKPRRASTRGGSAWSSGDEKRLIFTANGDLVSLDAMTGKPDPGFGDRGRVSLGELPSGEKLRDFHWSSAPLICGDTIVVGQSTADAWTRQKNEPGTIRGFDVRSGSQLWTFYIVPRPGEEGYDSWLDGSADYTGAGNVWTWMSCDEELGRVFAATSTPSNDWYGGHRPGDGLFAESILALDARTGKKAWHFQAVHHGIWDYDFPAAPILADVEINGEPRKLLAQVSKQAFLYVFDRVSGEPIWPILELPVPPSLVEGEKASPTQPHPSWPLPYDRQGLALDDLIDFTPELRQMALDYVAQYQMGPIFAPPTLIEDEAGKKELATLQLPGPVGGTNWNGAALDKETGILYVPSVTVPTVMGLRPPPDPARSDLKYRVDLSEADGYEWATLSNGLPITKPPYGRITAIDLATGKHLWMVPNGEGPRDHPALKDLDLPRLGHAGRASPLVTATLLFLADGTPDMPVVPPWAGGRMFRAYDKANGDLVWEYELPAGASGAPMTYLFEGKQYIVVSVSEREHEGELIAFALPQN